MKREAIELTDVVVRELRERIAQSRRGRYPKSPLAPDLWADAARIARQVGPYRAAGMLGVSYESLRRRVGDAVAVPARRARRAGRRRAAAEVPQSKAAGVEAEVPPLTFVELHGTSISPRLPGGTVIEMQSADGTRVTVQLGHDTPVDVAALVAAVSGRRA